MAHHFDPIDVGGSQGEGPLNADAERDLPDREAAGIPSAPAKDNSPFEQLDALAVAFNDLDGDVVFDSGTESSLSGVNNVSGGDVLGYNLLLPELGAAADYAFDTGTLEGWSVAGSSGTVFWHVSTVRSSSGAFSIHYANPGTGFYDDGLINNGTLTSPSVALGASPFMTFDYFLENEWGGPNIRIPNLDALSVEISTDGGTTWTVLDGYLATTGGTFYTYSVDLTAYASQTVNVRFLFDTGDSIGNNFEGAYVDNVKFH